MDMETLNNSKTIKTAEISLFFPLIVLVIAIVAVLLYCVRVNFFMDIGLNAALQSSELVIEEALVYSDNTKGAKRWLWEFGDGNQDTNRTGAYQYKKPGSYLVRLTVNGVEREHFTVLVKDTLKKPLVDAIVRVVGPEMAYVNEQIRMEVKGEEKIYDWYFGETARLDREGKVAFYRYRRPGTYMIKLRTSKTEPIFKQIVIKNPAGAEIDVPKPGEREEKILEDIRWHLQKLINGGDFNINYNYIYNKYLCAKGRNMVKVNENRETVLEFRNYCLSLLFDNTIIVDKVEMDVSSEGCINGLIVRQHRKNQ